MKLPYYLAIIRKRLWVVILTCIVGIAISFWYSLAKPPMYRSVVTLMIHPATSEQGSNFTQAELARGLAATYVEYLKTEAFAEKVVKNLELDLTIEELLGSMSASFVPDTQFLKIVAISLVPEEAQKIAANVAETFIAENEAQQQTELAAQEEADAETELMREKLENALGYYEEQTTFLQARLEELKAQPPSQQIFDEILGIQRELVGLEQLKVEVINNLTELRPAPKDVAINRVTIVSPATFPRAPLNRGIVKNALLAAVAGIALGLLLAFLPEYLDYTFRTPEDLEAALNSTALGAIQAVDYGADPEDKVELLVTRHYPRSSVAEAFRALRTNIKFARPDKEIDSMLVTSGQPGDGKSLVAANLSVAIAQGGKNVILVDADLRRPSIHRFFGLPNRAGFTDLILDSTVDFADYLQETDVPNLRVLTSGPLPPNPLDMLSSQRASQLIDALKADADVVIFDTPPIVTVTDAQVISPQIETALLVVAAGSTPRDVVMKAYQSLQRIDIDVLGPVLNRVRLADLGYYYHYYYYGYYYEAGAGTETEEVAPMMKRLPPVKRRS